MNINLHMLLALLAVLVLVVADWFLGVLAALRDGTFSFHALPKQLATTVLPVVGSLVVLAILEAFATTYTQFGAETEGVFYLAAAAYAPGAIIDILQKAQAILARRTVPAG